MQTECLYRVTHNLALLLLAGVLLAVPTQLDCRRQAFAGQKTLPLFRVFAVPFAAVPYAGLPPVSNHLVGAAAKHALAWTAAVFLAETLAFRVGGAARHGARLVSAAMFAAMRRSRLRVGGASCKRARSTRAMLGADTACSCKGGATFLLAHLLAATAVLSAPASSSDGSGALVERAGPIRAMFRAKPLCFSNAAAAFCRACRCLAVVRLALSSHSDGVVDARVRGAVSKGAVLDADKLAIDLRGLAVWVGAGQLRRVLAAQATFLHRGGGATFSKTLAISAAVFPAHPPCFCHGGAAIHRAGVASMYLAELAFVHRDARAAIRNAHLPLLLPPTPLLFLVPQQL